MSPIEVSGAKMGQSKMRRSDVDSVASLIRKWKGPQPCTWENIRIAIASQKGWDVSLVWSRVTLSTKEQIKQAYAHANDTKIDKDEAYAKLERDYKELNTKYEAAIQAQRTLAYNVSMGPNGGHLLLLPLPDNIAVQENTRKRKSKQR